MLINPNTLSLGAGDAIFRNWRPNTANGLWILSTDSVNLDLVTGAACWASYDEASDRVSIGTTNCPVATLQMLGAENASDGIYLTKQNTSSEIVLVDTNYTKVETKYSDTIYSRLFTAKNYSYTSLETMYGNYQGWIDTYADQCTIGVTTNYGAANSFNVIGRVLPTYAELTTKYGATTNVFENNLTTASNYTSITAYGGSSPIKSSFYSDSSSTAITAEYSSTIKSRMGATSTYSDFYTTSSTNHIRLKTDSNSALTLENIAYGGTGPASKSISLSIADITPTSAIIKLREFSICVNGETKKCLILASDFYT